MSARHSGYRLPSPVEQYFEDRKLEQVTTASCFFCGATFHGTARDCFDWATEHRAVEHPDAVDRGQRARREAAKAATASYWTSRNALGEM